MITHIALFQFRPDTSPADLQRAIEDVRALKEKVDGLITVDCGANFSKWADGFTHAFVVTARDLSALDAYRRHPDHVDVAHRLEAMEVRSIGVDFES